LKEICYIEEHVIKGSSTFH